jgi:hypothetical protein
VLSDIQHPLVLWEAQFLTLHSRPRSSPVVLFDQAAACHQQTQAQDSAVPAGQECMHVNLSLTLESIIAGRAL